MKAFNPVCVSFIILCFCIIANSKFIENQDFEELTREEIAQMKRTNFFRRILQESQTFFNKKTIGLNEDLGRLISIKQKITGIMTQYKLKFLSNKGFYQVQLEAIESQNIINFINLTEQKFSPQIEPSTSQNSDQNI